jgi:hypothetical protein
MERQQKPTEAQAGIIRRAGLSPAQVTVQGKSADLPLAITYHGDGKPLKYWVSLNKGNLRLTDTNPCLLKTQQGEETQRPETADTTPGPDQKAEILLAGVDPDLGHGLTRDEADSWLRERGLSKRDRALVLGHVFDKASVRQLETATGWKKTQIAGKLKSPTIKRCIEELKSGRPLASPKPPELLPVSKFLDEARILREWQQVNNPLHRLMEWAARELDWQALSYLEVKRPARNVTRESFWDNEKVTGGLRMLREDPEKLKNLPRGIMNYIRAYPALLLLPEGKVLLRGLVDVLEEARFGTSRRRVRALMPEGSRKARAKAAQDALAWLARGNRGEKLHYRLDEIMMYLKLRVTQLQAEYKATENMPTTAMRREKLREDHREELEKFTDRELQNLVNDEPVKVAARVAEKATGLSQETFLRARREIEAELTEERERAKSFEHFFPQMGRVSR